MSIATQLNSTQLDVELSCVAINGPSDACKSAPEASRRLRSSGSITCVIPWSRTHLGDRSFDVAGPSCLLHCGHLTVSAYSEDS